MTVSQLVEVHNKEVKAVQSKCGISSRILITKCHGLLAGLVDLRLLTTTNFKNKQDLID